MSRVLVTGATGYVGSRVIPELVERGYRVVAAARRPDALADYPWADDVEAVRFDVDDADLVAAAVEGCDAVVYLVHSMDGDDFVQRDREAAERVAAACADAGVGRIVYLSGLVPPGELSDHLRSRLQVEEVFLASSTPSTVLRAAMVVGAGSTSFELLRRLSERTPFTPVPTWMRSRLQPVAVEDVVHLVAQALEGDPRNRHYDVGGDTVLTYPELLRLFADVAGIERRQVSVPWAPKWAVGRVSALLSGMDSGTVTALVDSLSHDMVCQEDDVRHELGEDRPFTGLREALQRSLEPDGGTTDRGDVQAGAPTDPS